MVNQIVELIDNMNGLNGALLSVSKDKFMLCVNVELQERRYPILIGNGLLQDERSYPVKRGERVMIVTKSHGCTVFT